jgi:photosystem II stability/assembly factor-like uncharacterized protein
LKEVWPLSVTAPPRSTDTHDDRDLEQRVADLEALIEEARRRARRRRRLYGAAALAAGAAVAGALFGVGGHGNGSVAGEVAAGAPSGAAAPRGRGLWGPSVGPDGGASTLAVDGSNPEVLYAAGFGDVYKSVDGGRSWRKGPPEPWRRVSALTVDATRHRVVYAGTDRGIAKTVDGGRRWRLVNRGLFTGETRYERGHRLGEGFVSSIVVDGHDPQTVYAITGTGLFRTTSGGDRWQIIGPSPFRSRSCDLCGGRYYGYSLAAAIDPSSGTIYASWTRGGLPATLYRSTDTGRRWNRVAMRGRPRPDAVELLAIDRKGTLYASGQALPGMSKPTGVLRSSDGGRTWAAAGLATQTVWELQVDRGNGSTLYASTDFGLRASSDGGRTWGDVADGPDGPTSAVVSVPKDPSLRYGVSDGVVRSVDDGRTWTPANDGLIATGVSSLVLAPGSAGILYAGDAKSLDGGKTWRREGDGLRNAVVEKLAVDPQDPRTLYAGTQVSGLYKSTDAGASWKGLDTGGQSGFVSALAVDPRHPGTVYVDECGLGCGTYGELLKTVDGGTSWRPLTLPAPSTGRTVQVVAIDPQRPNIVFAGTTSWFRHPGLFRSSDGGSSWQRAVTTPRLRSYAADAIAIDPRDPDNVYAASSRDGILKSGDRGETWAAANKGLTDKGIVALAIDPAHPRVLYASTGGAWTTKPARVFRSTDGARTWHSISAGVPAVGVQAFAIDSSGRSVFAGTGGDGVIKLRSPG